MLTFSQTNSCLTGLETFFGLQTAIPCDRTGAMARGLLPPNTASIWAVGPRKGYPWGQGRVSVSVGVTRENRRSRRVGGMKPKSFIRKIPNGGGEMER